MSKKQAIVTIGVSGSGKSTWARSFVHKKFLENLSWSIIERDAIRREMIVEQTEGSVNELVWSLWNWKKEKQVSERQKELIQKKSLDPEIQGIIISDTNLVLERRNDLMVFLENLGFEVKIQDFSSAVNFKEAVRRDGVRPNSVGPFVIKKQFNQLRESQIKEGIRKIYKPNPTTKLSTFLFDLDGTVAHNTSGRSPFDWKRVGEDTLDKAVFQVIKGLSVSNTIVFISGRDSVCREETQEWLKAHQLDFYDELLMREKNDMRPDEIVKEEIFWRDIEPVYNVLGIFDDRPKICRMWQDIGVKTFILGDPWIEF